MNEFPAQFGGTHKRPRYGVQNNMTAPSHHHGSHTGHGGGHYGPGGSSGGGGGGRGMQGRGRGGRGQGRGHHHAGGNNSGSMLKDSMLQDPWQHMMTQLVSQGLSSVKMVSHPNNMQQRSVIETTGIRPISTATSVYKNTEEISLSDEDEVGDDVVDEDKIADDEGIGKEDQDAVGSHED